MILNSSQTWSCGTFAMTCSKHFLNPFLLLPLRVSEFYSLKSGASLHFSHTSQVVLRFGEQVHLWPKLLFMTV